MNYGSVFCSFIFFSIRDILGLLSVIVLLTYVLMFIQAQLRERNEALFSKLGSVHNKLGQQAASKSDLSVKLVQCEEEKLKVYLTHGANVQSFDSQGIK